MPSAAVWCLSVALFASLCGPSRSSGGTFYDSEYVIDSWQTEQGLPENSANALVQTPDGYLWFATFDGLVRYEGTRFTVFNTSNTPGLPSDGIVNLHLDQSGRLWISTLKGIAILKKNRWSNLNESMASQNNLVRTFSESAGVLCLTTFDGKVFRVQEGRPVQLAAPPGLAGQGYFGFVDRAGTIWAGQDHFFGHWDGQRWIASPLASVVTNRLKGLGPGRHGSLLAVSGNTLLRIDDRQVTARLALDDDPGALWRIYEDSGGNIWLCTQEKGLYRVSPSGATRHFSTANGLTEMGVRFAFEDREKNLWLGASGGGLMRMKRRTFAQADLSAFSPTLRATALVQESPGRILIGSSRGLGRMENGRFDRVSSLKGGRIPNAVQSVLADRAGNLWIATYHRGVFVLDKNLELRSLPAADTGGVDSAALFEDSRGRVWIGGGETVSLFANGEFVAVTNAAGLPLGGVTCFAESQAGGVIWAGGAEGLFRFEGGQWSEVKDADGRSLNETTCLRADADGALWIGGSSIPLRRFRAGLLTTISEAQGLPVRMITAILDDGLGYLWLASSRGVVRVARAELERAAQDGRYKFSSQVFNLRDGLPSAQCVGGYQSTALKDSEGRLWFATTRGVATIDPRTVVINTNPPPVFIEQFRIEKMSGQQTYVSTSVLKPILVPPGQREIKVVFCALSYTAPEKVRFAYKIEGLQDDWVDIGNRSDLYFYPPPPGEYRFLVKAANNDGIWNETGAALAFTVQPFWWQTVWFRVLGLAGMLGGTGWTVWRVGQSKTNRRIERLEQERVLERERAHLASVLETTSDFVGFSTPDGQMLFVNRAGRRMLGIGETEDVRSIKVADHYPAWAEKLVRATALPTAIREGTWSGELALKHRDGREIPVSQVIVTHRAPDGSLDFVSTIARDISEQKKAVRALRESEERFRHLTEASFEGVCISQGGRVRDVNDQFLKMFGYQREEVIGKPIVDLVAPGSRALVEEAIRTGREGAYEHQLLRKDGTLFYAEAQAKSIQISGCKLRMTALRDITERKQMETLANGQREILEKIAGDAPLQETLDALLVTIEAQAEELLCSILLLDADGAHLRHAAAPRLPEAYIKAIDGEPIGPRSGSCGTAAFRRKPVLVEDIATDPLWENYRSTALAHGLRACWSSPIFDAQQNILGTFAVYHRRTGLPSLQDLALIDLATHTAAIAIARYRAKAALRQTEEQLRQAQKMEGIGQLAGGVAHDFNNILTALIMQTQLTEMVEHLPWEARDGLRQIRADAQRAAELTRQLLLFSRRQVMQARLLDLNELITNMSKMLKRIIGEDVDLRLSLHGAPLLIHADAGMIDQVLMNLALNARDAMPGGGRLLIRTAVTILKKDDTMPAPDAGPGRYVCFSVSDTGEGIPPAVLPQIFEPFFTTKELGKGTGLGLATVFGIVKQHRGWIKVDNRPGEGVTFQIFLPGAAAPPSEAQPAEAAISPSGGAETILLVEDESAVRKPMREILEHYGYKVLEAASGPEALKIWRENRAAVSLLLTDLVMPGGMNGQELAWQLQAEQPDLKVIFASGYSGDIAGQDVRLSTGEAFIQKPFTTDHLLETIRRTLDA